MSRFAQLVLVVVRPYGPSMRRRVFAALDELGLPIANAHTIEVGTPNDEVLAALSERTADLLLMPFHAHRDRRGRLAHGVDLLLELRRTVPRHATTRVLAPVSTVGMAAAELLRARVGPEALGPVLFLPETELDTIEARERIHRFLSASDQRPTTDPTRGEG